MKNIGKYMLVGLMLMSVSACSNDSNELLSSESAEVSRSSELISEEVTLSSAGTLSTTLTKDPATLQKLKISGEYNEADVNYWLNNLTNLVELDLSAATPKHSTTGDSYSASNDYISFSGFTFNDNDIGAYQFSAMAKLESVILPSTTAFIGDYAFEYCPSLTSIVIPASVTGIGYGVFQSCPNLVSATVSSATMTRIPDAMFYNCPKLETVTLASNIVEVGNDAFGSCLALKSFPFTNITKINHSSFHASGLETADLSSVEDFSNAGWSFRLCESLQSVVLPDNLDETLPGAMFWGCTKLSSVNFPAGMETIGDQVFGGCGFTELTIPATVKSIGYESFHANRSLTKIILSEGLETISERAFTEAAFTEITIPSTVTYIGGAAFESSKLKTLTVPATVTEVGGNLINGCSNLSALVWNSAAPVDDTWGVNSNCYLFIPNADVVVGPNWKNIIVGGVAEIVELCLNGNRAEHFSIPVSFTAKKITYTQNFDRETVPGESSGWETIVLPFTPTKIEHETKGVVAPFNSQVEGAKPFWLRELTAEGFVDKTTIEPNKAYIIAMPNHNDYVEDYRLNGKITFSAENVELVATPETLSPSVGPEYSLQPTYNYVQHGVSIYALNTEYWIDGYHMGSVFVRNTSDIYAFEAYVTLDGRSARSLYDIDTKSKASRSADQPNKTGIPQIGDM
ncbi:MAG: leucine-rich repeat protein [Bacteroides sp]|nr:leucine-rich repeat protein [Bacteroides sp.]